MLGNCFVDLKCYVFCSIKMWSLTKFGLISSSVGKQKGGQGSNCDSLAWHARDCDQRHNVWWCWGVSPLRTFCVPS